MTAIGIMALTGFGSALVVDLMAYSASPEGQAFNWAKAGARWIAGAVTAVLVGTGANASIGN